MNVRVCAAVPAIVMACLAFSGSAGAGIRKSLNVKTGAPNAGLALAAIPEKKVFKFGDPVWILIEVRNLETHTQFIVGPQAAVNYKFIVRNVATGKVLPPRSPALSGNDIYSAGPFEIHQGSSFVLRASLSDFVRFDQPGTYEVDVATRSVKPEPKHADAALAAPPLIIRIDI